MSPNPRPADADARPADPRPAARGDEPPLDDGAGALASLRAEQVTCDFGRLRALHRVSFEVRAGEALAVLGPNGAGKSTLLSVLATLQRPSAGRVVVDERADAWADRQVVRAHVGLVAHELMAWPELTGRETLEVHARLRGVAPERVDAWLGWMGLAEAAHRPLSEYSRGMKQRVSIARALLHSPSVVLLDEPLTGLDRRSGGDFYELVRSLRRRGRIVVMITHSFDAPVDVFDRALVLDRGRVVHDGPVGASMADCYDRALRGRGERP